MSKSVLVLCSSPQGSDYPAKDNQDMLDTLLKGVKPSVDFLSGEDAQRFPEDMRKGKLYDIILFAGCNANIFIDLLREYETSINLLSSSLKKNGLILVTESEKFIKKYISAKHYTEHRLTLKLDTLLKKHPSPGIQDKKEEYTEIVTYWNTKFKAQQTKKDKYIVYQHTVAKAKEASPVKQEIATKAEKEDVCKSILEKVKEILSNGGADTKLMEAVRDTLKEKQIVAIIGRKGTVKKMNMNTSNINALGGEEACKSSVRAIKIALQDISHSAEERVKEIRRQAGLDVRPNKTARVSNNSNSAQTPEADFFSLFDASDPINRDLATLNGIFKVNLLEHDAVYDREEVETAAVLKNGAEKVTFSIEQGKEIKERTIRKNVEKKLEGKNDAEKESAVQAKIAEEAEQSREDFGRLYGDVEGDCADVKITLECMHASGSNSDCFFHSFLGATCEFYRMAKAAGKPYNSFVTRFRKEIVPQIIEYFYTLEEEGKPVVTMSAEDLTHELNAPGQFLPDDLFVIIAYYYKCAILLLRPKQADGIRVAALIGKNTEATYGISNSAGVHFEPLRITGQNTYRLSESTAKCLAYTYSQLSGTTATVDVKRFKEMGKVAQMANPGADGVTVYDEAALLDRLSDGAQIREGSEPGDVTRVYMGMRDEGYDELKTSRVRQLQEMISRLTRNYKDRQMFANAKMAPESQDLEDSIQLLQQGVVDGIKDDADIAEKEAEVVAFIERPTRAEAKRAAKKRGGRRTVRREREGRKTPRA